MHRQLLILQSHLRRSNSYYNFFFYVKFPLKSNSREMECRRLSDKLLPSVQPAPFRSLYSATHQLTYSIRLNLFAQDSCFVCHHGRTPFRRDTGQDSRCLRRIVPCRRIGTGKHGALSALLLAMQSISMLLCCSVRNNSTIRTSSNQSGGGRCPAAPQHAIWQTWVREVRANVVQSWPVAAHAEEEQPKVALSPKEWKGFKLAKKVTVARNDATGISTVWLRFSLDSPDQPLGLPVAACFVTR